VKLPPDLEARVLRLGSETARVNHAAFGPGPVYALPVANEEEFQLRVIDLAHAHGWKAAHFRKVRVQRKGGAVYYETPVQADGAGFPDLILRRGVVLIAAELKFGKNKPTPEQLEWLRGFAAAGNLARVWYPAHWEDIVSVLTSHPEETHRDLPRIRV
jgi:hypothetical protein